MVEILWHRRETRRQTENTNLYLNLQEPKLLARSCLAFARFGANYEFKANLRPGYPGRWDRPLYAAPTLRLSEIYIEAPGGSVLRLEKA